MNYNTKIAIIAAAAILGLPAAATAEVEIYGAAKLSVDAIDDGADNSTGVSNNASRLGLRGEQALDKGYKAVFKLESSVDFTGETGTLNARDRYAGLAGSFGELRFGILDTPFKEAGARFDIFGDTIGDRRNILGIESDGDDTYNQRAKNSIVYVSPKLWNTQLVAQYSTANTSTATASGADNNDLTLASAGAVYAAGPLMVQAAYEKQKTKGDGVRLGGSYSFGATKLGLIFETLDGDGNAALTRDAFGANVQHSLGNTTLKAQLLSADDSEAGNDTGALNYTLGVFHKLAKQVEVYAAYSATDNANNAKYPTAAGGHDGDKIITQTAGLDPSAFSLGLIVGF